MAGIELTIQFFLIFILTKHNSPTIIGESEGVGSLTDGEGLLKEMGIMASSLYLETS